MHQKQPPAKIAVFVVAVGGSPADRCVNGAMKYRSTEASRTGERRFMAVRWFSAHFVSK